MNISRRATCGEVDPEEVLNKSQTYVTTAGYKGTFAYQKLIQLLVWQVIAPKKAFVLGGSWRVPVLHNLLDKNFIEDLKMDGTFNEMSFEREYESIWTGSAEDAFFNGEVFDKYRVIQLPEYSNSLKKSEKAYYVLSIDVGRLSDKTSVIVYKVVPKLGEASIAYVVNIFEMVDEHFESQSIKIKKIWRNFEAEKIILDGNGIGVGLLDYILKPQVDLDGTEYPALGVDYQNDEQMEHYKKYETQEMVKNMIYIIKATPQINSDMHVNALSRLSSGKVRLLIDHQVAKSKLLATKKGQQMSSEERAEYLRPFTSTSILKEEMMNLRKKEDSKGKVALERVNRKIHKDRFSSFEQGLYYIKLEDDKNKRARVSLTNFVVGTKSKNNIHQKRTRSKIVTRRGRN